MREKCPNAEFFLVHIFLYSDWIQRFTSCHNELGRISKLILDKINKKISQKSELNQWKNTDIVLDWFKQIRNKHFYKFARFDIKEFCLSIKECLLKNAIHFAKQHTEIFKKDKAIIFHARKALLFNDQHVWIKRKECYLI